MDMKMGIHFAFIKGVMCDAHPDIGEKNGENKNSSIYKNHYRCLFSITV